MNRLDLFPTEVFWWDWESEVDHLVEASKKYVSTDIPVDQSNSDLHTKPEYRELFTWITKCANEIKEYYQFHCESFKITTAWVNRVTSKQDIHFHRHPMSAYSGVFYLTGGSPLCFRQPNPLQVHKSTIPISDINKDMYMVEPIKGRLIMFPWWLEHGSINDLDNERWSIAFNTLPYGKINYNDGNNLSSVYLEF